MTLSPTTPPNDATASSDAYAIGRDSRQLVKTLAALKSRFVGKDLVIDLLGVGLVARENVFLYGPPGTAKSAIVGSLARAIDGRAFDYLLTRFTEPSELFGPFDIRRLREGDLITNTDGMLPEADLVFLDELLNANSAILNALLLALNERVFRRGRETTPLPTLMVVAAGNSLPEDEALAALFDRFLVRVLVDNVEPDRLGEVLRAGWTLESDVRHSDAGKSSDGSQPDAGGEGVSPEAIRRLQSAVAAVDLDGIRTTYVELIAAIRRAGIAISDRRAVRFQRLLAASAILCGRLRVIPSDLWVLRSTWDRPEQQSILAALVDEASKTAEMDVAAGDGPDHPQSQIDAAVDAEALAADLTLLADELAAASDIPTRLAIRDRLALLAGRVQWLPAGEQRSELDRWLAEQWAALASATDEA